MMTELCQYLRNWFNRKPDGTDYDKWTGTFTIEDGVLTGVELADGQYYRIMGSLFNDGVHKHGDENDTLTDETFFGDVWSMGVPQEVIQLATDIANWNALYGGPDSEAMSPFASESFGGYSYSKAQGNAGEASASSWQAVFSARLGVWKKI